ncbi:MAG: sulfatase [Candidatus Nitrosotenuis sp.]
MSFFRFFKLIFVIFFLYLLGDAFYRWDGFRYHTSFFDFLPTVSLVFFLWSILAIFAAFSIFIIVKLLRWLFHYVGYRILEEHFVMYCIYLLLLTTLTWIVKKFLFANILTGPLAKMIIFIIILFLSIFLTWISRKKAKRWVDDLLERFTPIVWISIVLSALSGVIVTYKTVLSENREMVNKETKQEITPLFSFDKTRPNIILITFDALSAKNMTIYGYERDTTPFLFKFAKESFVFTNLKSASNWTTPAVASLMTGKRVWTHHFWHLYSPPPLKSDVESLPRILKQNGYYNVAIVANPLASVRTLGIDNSFDYAPSPLKFSVPRSLIGSEVEAFGIIDKYLYDAFSGIKFYNWIIHEDFILGRLLRRISADIFLTTTPPDIAFEEFLKLVDTNLPQPFFVWIHLLPPHAPYLPPEKFIGAFNSLPGLKTFNEQNEIFKKRGWYRQFEDFPENVKPSIEVLRIRYDEYIKYCDEELNKFIKRVISDERLRDTIFVISSDHGESFEHSYLTHGGPHLYEPVAHIPLIIKLPKQHNGQVIEDIIEQIDIAPTILDILNIPIPAWMEGRSFEPLIKGKQLPSKPAFSMNLEANKRNERVEKGVVGVWNDNYKLIHYMDIEKKDNLLFNLKEDPDELNNLFDKERDVGQYLLNLIKEELKKANEKIINSGVVKN